MRHAVILAGGAGTRLWPLSRQARPKQLLRLIGGRSLLQLALERLEGLFAPEQTWVITSADHVEVVAREVPNVPRENIVGEPVGRDTANAIGLAANLIALRDPGATMAVFPADHLIEPRDRFQQVLSTGLSAVDAHADALLTFGIVPTEAHTGYGYIHRGDALDRADASGAYQVRAFREKPDADTARAYLASGEYYWNSGMFVWSVATIRAELERLLPENQRALAEITAKWGDGVGDDVARAFGELRKISIDFGVMEHARRVLVVPMDCRWLDVGSWTALQNVAPADADGNVTVGTSLTPSAKNNVLVSEDDHLLVALGVEDLIVVHASDVTLVCRQQDEQRVRELVALCQERFGERYS